MTKEQAAKLVKEAQHGNRRAFEELIRAKQRQILFISFTKLGNMHDAEEVMQESMIDVFKSINSLKNPNSFDAWLNRIIISNCHKQRKKYDVLKRDVDTDDATLDIPEVAADFIPEEYAEQEELRREVYQVVMSLPEVRRDTILMYYYEDMSLKEIAEATGVAEATAASNISRARKMMKVKIGELSQKGRPIYGTASATALGRILQGAAIEIVPNSQLAVVERNLLDATRALEFILRKAPAFHNAAAIASCAIVVTSVLSAAVILHNTADGESVATPPAVTQPAVQPSAPPPIPPDEGNQAIAFVGNDCDCGHINPSAVTIIDPQDGDAEPSWTINNSETGATVFSGNTEGTNATLASLSARKADGSYVIHCVFTDVAGRTIALDRPFIVGNYHGDS